MKTTKALLITIYFLLCALTITFLCLTATYLPAADAQLRRVTVPNLVGVPSVQTENTLPSDLFEITYDYRADTSAPVGTVLSQFPPAGSTRRVLPRTGRCQVRLTISTGPARYTIPRLIGQSARTAKIDLRAHGITVRLVERIRADLPDGQILSSHPTEGATVSEGETVILTVVKAPVARSLRVPDVVGVPQPVANGVLILRGLTPTASNYVYSDTVPAGDVVAQIPLPDTLVPAGTTATLTISLGRPDDLWGSTSS